MAQPNRRAPHHPLGAFGADEAIAFISRFQVDYAICSATVINADPADSVMHGRRGLDRRVSGLMDAVSRAVSRAVPRAVPERVAPCRSVRA